MSYVNASTTVEKAFAMEFPYLIMQEQRKRGMKCGEFASHLGISVESLEDYRNGDSIPRADTFFKIAARCSIEFVMDAFAILGLHDKYSIVSNQSKPQTGISIVANRRG